MRALLAAALVFVAQSALASGKSAKPRSDADAARFTEAEQIGRTLADSDLAVASATRTLLAQPHDGSHVNTFFALHKPEAWFVYFGWLPVDGKSFTPSYVLRGGLDGSGFKVVPPAEAPGDDLLAYARAVTQARIAAIKATTNPHVNPILVPEKDAISVWVLQSGARPGYTLLGGDFHDRYDKQGVKLLSRTQFHKSVIVVQEKDPEHPDAEAVGSFHSHVVAEEPTATDVAEVLLHPNLAPMFVRGRSGKSYRVDKDGKLHAEGAIDAAHPPPEALELNADALASPAPTDVPVSKPDAAATDGGKPDLSPKLK